MLYIIEANKNKREAKDMSKGKIELPKSEWSFTPFKGLHDAIKHKKHRDSKKVPISNKTEEEIFLEAMADVREIKEFRAIPIQRPPKIEPHQPMLTDDSIKVLKQIVKGKIKIRLSDTGEYIEWISPNLKKNIAQKLHQGNFSVQDYIDLHGMTVSEAEEALTLFLHECLKRQLFCVKIIHGRGLRSVRGPVLKEALIKWLQGSFRKWVLAYATARDCDGGLGATYIILKSR
jgi:DNA-nicking Smr family endonuclease